MYRDRVIEHFNHLPLRDFGWSQLKDFESQGCAFIVEKFKVVTFYCFNGIYRSISTKWLFIWWILSY